jgi:hypothetical protein
MPAVYLAQEEGSGIPIDELKDSEINDQEPENDLMLWYHRLVHD